MMLKRLATLETQCSTSPRCSCSRNHHRRGSRGYSLIALKGCSAVVIVSQLEDASTRPAIAALYFQLTPLN